jgi:hypothetical protein
MIGIALYHINWVGKIKADTRYIHPLIVTLFFFDTSQSFLYFLFLLFSNNPFKLGYIPNQNVDQHFSLSCYSLHFP